MKFDHDFFFYGHSTPSADSRRAVVSYKQKYLHLGEVRLTEHLDMTIAVDWDVKPQTKQ